MGFSSDVALCARAIFDDLVRFLDELDISNMRELCVWHSCRLLPDPSLPISVGAHWDGEQILLAVGLDSSDRSEAIPHELVHALADEPRWEPLNYRIHAIEYDRQNFIEAIASEVGQLFRLAHALTNRLPVTISLVSEKQLRRRFRRHIERMRRQRSFLEERFAMTQELVIRLRAQAAAFAAAFEEERYDVPAPDPVQASLCKSLLVDLTEQISILDRRLERWECSSSNSRSV